MTDRDWWYVNWRMVRSERRYRAPLLFNIAWRRPSMHDHAERLLRERDGG